MPPNQHVREEGTRVLFPCPQSLAQLIREAYQLLENSFINEPGCTLEASVSALDTMSHKTSKTGGCSHGENGVIWSWNR